MNSPKNFILNILILTVNPVNSMLTNINIKNLDLKMGSLNKIPEVIISKHILDYVINISKPEKLDINYIKTILNLKLVCKKFLVILNQDYHKNNLDNLKKIIIYKKKLGLKLIHAIKEYKQNDNFNFLKNQNLQEIKSLIEQGASLNEVDEKLSSAIHEAIKIYNIDILELLIKNHANVNIQNQDGNTVLMSVDVCFNKDKIKLLLSSNVNINIKNKNNMTALKFAKKELALFKKHINSGTTSGENTLNDLKEVVSMLEDATKKQNPESNSCNLM